jgi:hypothetical protein
LHQLPSERKYLARHCTVDIGTPGLDAYCEWKASSEFLIQLYLETSDHQQTNRAYLFSAHMVRQRSKAIYTSKILFFRDQINRHCLSNITLSKITMKAYDGTEL